MTNEELDAQVSNLVEGLSQLIPEFPNKPNSFKLMHTFIKKFIRADTPDPGDAFDWLLVGSSLLCGLNVLFSRAGSSAHTA